jgi:hypothetical protein
MTIAINPTLPIVVTRAISVDKESTRTLKSITQQLSGVANKEIVLRLKMDSSGRGRLKPMPEKLSFLARTFSGIRYANEAARASEYFGLSGRATTGAAISKTKPLTDTLLQPIGQKPFNALTPTGLRVLREKLSHLNDGTVLQVDSEGNLRTARPGTSEDRIYAAKVTFSMKNQPTVSTVRSIVDARLAELTISELDQQSLREMSRPGLETLHNDLSGVVNNNAELILEGGHLGLSPTIFVHADPAADAAKYFGREQPLTTSTARQIVADEIARRDSPGKAFFSNITETLSYNAR